MRALIVSLALFVLSPSGRAQEEARGLFESRELEGFIDGYFAAYLEDANVAGATVAVIENETIVLAKGYGHSDVSTRAPVDPAGTLFRIGSVSKLFVWTSVMQLVEQGKLELDADINEYLTDLTVPDAFGGPVTMSQLMTHTAGFDERVLGLFSRDASRLRPLGEVLKEELPPRVRPGGDLVSYSNHRTGLAMYAVEQIAGISWDEYIDANLLRPLGLHSTSFAQPLPDELASRMSKGYRFEGGEFVERPFEYIPLAPVGAAASTATDLARFLAAHLGLGSAFDARILEEDTSRRMQRSLFRPHPDVNGMAHGFMEMDLNGARVIGHGGDTELFHTLFAFFPDHHIGVVASFNTAGADYMRFLEAFVDWLFPVERQASPSEETSSGLGRFAGHYRPTRYPHRTIAKLSALLSTFEVRVENDHLVTSEPKKRRWLKEAPLVFREEGESSTLAFRESEDGRITHLFLSEIPVISFERAPAAEKPGLVASVLSGGLAVIVLAVVFWPAAVLARRHYGVTLERERRTPALARWSAWAGSALLVVFALGLAVLLRDPMQVVYGLPGWASTLFWLPVLTVLFAALAFIGVVRAWRHRRGSVWGRLGLTSVVLALFLVVWQLVVWNLAFAV